ncbi:EAL domain-containing protein [Granulicella arctica]|uniref:EAL domain-containing protein n=1 Tax=Granulicella arctica TaxID=940613 RepID=UPI00295B5DE7|nr:EAL domain-containing protein [Granulicella arctica]
MMVKPEQVRQALHHDELVPCFQPLVALATGELIGFEVLARWRHPQQGLILPENFISIAESEGLIGELTDQILGKAFLSAPSLPEALILAVNLSPRQLYDLNLPGQISDAAEKASFPLERLKLEITENALVDDIAGARKTIGRLKALGCKLALDDFGTGYSSLQHLHVLPFDELKIDRSFVAAMTRKRESRKIVAAIIGLGHSLGLSTLAEGIETEAQADMLLRLGCKQGQGWLYGQPLEAASIGEVIRRTPRIPSVPNQTTQWVVSSLEALPAQRLAQMQAIYDGAPVGIAFLDCNLRYISINKRLAEMNGSAIAAHLGKTVEEMIPDAYPILKPYLLRALRGEAISDVLVSRPGVKLGGADWAALLSYHPALDEGDEVIGIAVAVVDVTRRERAEEALAASKDHFENMVELIPQMPWTMSPEGDILDVSSRWSRTTGLSKEDSLKRGWLHALHPEDVDPTVKIVNDALRTGEPIDVEYRVVRPEGGWRWMRARGTALRGPSGEIIRWYGSVEDIEALKQMEEALRMSRGYQKVPGSKP